VIISQNYRLDKPLVLFQVPDESRWFSNSVISLLFALETLYCHSSIAITVAVVVFCVIAGRPIRIDCRIWIYVVAAAQPPPYRQYRSAWPLCSAGRAVSVQLVVNLPSPKEQEARKAKWNRIECAPRTWIKIRGGKARITFRFVFLRGCCFFPCAEVSPASIRDFLQFLAVVSYRVQLLALATSNKKNRATSAC